MTTYEGHIVMVDGVKYKSVNGQWVPFGSQVIASGELHHDLSRFPMPPAETANPEPHTPSADIGPKVSEHG